ncbi:coiled-coil domain-containing protein 112-like [Ostrea edulis]|uniref:coiled-coil domain-containing protein 112-like n=1 Tax=Ostrea edulis TaxID=37623 RepID=UPI0024AF3D57|nr:coiled-coil domain-containing protein 112-like [Ostrea edulis]XP_048736049.2 coiled-coil domain-containing protein 112-like [Ostrea edulis]
MASNVKENDEREKNVLAWKNKMDKAKKGEILRELRKLSVQVVALEREKATHLYSKRNEFQHDFSVLEEVDSKMKSDLKSEQVKVSQQLEKISHMVKRFHKELKDVKPTPEFVEKLKVIMEEIEGTINSFKESQRKRYEELIRDERVTSQEIQALERKFDAWSQLSEKSDGKSKKAPAAPLASARDITKDLPPQVAAFEKFLEETGGTRGGWDEYDHGTFLKFRNRYKGKTIFIRHALVAIPTKTEEEIRDHEEWYQTYLSMNERKKESIRKWRDRKEGEKEEVLSKVESELAEQQQKEEQKQQRLKEQLEEEKRQRFSQLNAWKVQKELERAQAEERKLREALDKAKREEERKKEKAELRQKVDIFKKERKEEEQFLEEQKRAWDQEDKERQKQISAREIHRFRDRDQKKLEEKLAKEKEKENEKLEKQKRLERLKEQVDVEVDRDPNRLLKPTAGWTSRLKDKGSSGSGPVLHMPHRAVPSWRQGMT